MNGFQLAWEEKQRRLKAEQRAARNMPEHREFKFDGLNLVPVSPLEMRRALVGGEFKYREGTSGVYEYEGETYVLINNSLLSPT